MEKVISKFKNLTFTEFFNSLAKHPYTCVILLCALTLPFGLCEKSNLSKFSFIYALIVCTAILSVVMILGKIGSDYKTSAMLFAAVFIYTAGCIYIIIKNDFNISTLFWLFTIGIIVFAVILKIGGNLNTQTLIALMIICAIMLRLIYVLYTDSSSRQHDVGYFNFKWGHANYIEYWYNNGLKLPDFDVRKIWQYYHPPLHHMLMALLLRIYTVLGIEYDTACQALQILPMIYSSLCMIVSYRLFTMIKLKGVPLILAMGIVCFHPTFIILGGAFNNDILSVLFILLSAMWALKWYREQSFKNIIILALCIGLGMMSKLSTWMIAPAVAFLFIYAFFKNIKNTKKYISQFIVFIVICAPLALWWQIRNNIAFGVPITYVPYLSEKDVIYSGNIPLTKRLFDFTSSGQLNYVYDAFTAYGAPYNEFNPTLGLFKTAIFDEGKNGISVINFPQIKFTGPILFYISVILFLVCFIAFLISMFRKNSPVDKVTRIFYLIFFFVFLISYYLFAIKYPFTCTYNIRYCVPLIVLCAMGLGLFLKDMKKQSFPSIIFKYLAYIFTFAFCFMSCVLFTQIA